MADYLHIDANRVKFDIERLIAAYPELSDDDELRADMLEGSSDLDAVLTRIYRSMRADEGMAEGAKAFRADLDARQKRFEARMARKKAMILAILETADLPKKELPIATFTVSRGRERVVVENPDDLPQGFFETVRKPKSTEIKASIMAGQMVPGATVEWGDDYLTIRGK